MASLSTILNWLFHGLVQYILYWVPVVKPFGEDTWPPDAWWKYNSWSDWFLHRDGERRPDEHLVQRWFVMIFSELREIIVHAARVYTDSARDWLRSVVGYIRSGFSSTGAWLDYVQRQIGDYVPWWSSNLASAADWLRERFPASIRYGWQSWDSIWETIKSNVRGWARDRYDQARAWASDARSWITNTGNSIRLWRDRVAGWIDAFRNDPYGTVTRWLGEAWSWLRTFRQRGRETVIAWLGPDIYKILLFGRDCATFYYNLWGAGYRVLGDFVADPLGFLYTRIEQMLVDRW